MTDGPIIRSWAAKVRSTDVSDWIETFHDRVFPSMPAIDGFLGIDILQATAGNPCGVTVLKRWRDMDALRAFAGDHPERALIPDFMSRFFVEHDNKANFHTDIFQETAS